MPAFWRLSAKLGDFLKIPGGCRAEFLLPQPFRFIVAFFPQLATMASSGASDAALASAVLERERARMSLEDVRSWVAQRHFVGSLQVPEVGQTMTWEMAYRMRHNALLEAHSALEEVRDLLQQNEPAAALERVLEEVGDDANQEQAEEEELDDDPELPLHSQVLRQQLLESVQLPATAPQPLPFSGRCFRLDM